MIKSSKGSGQACGKWLLIIYMGLQVENTQSDSQLCKTFNVQQNTNMLWASYSYTIYIELR